MDATVPIWDYPEKPEISKYYLQFYHKTDKVMPPAVLSFEQQECRCVGHVC